MSKYLSRGSEWRRWDLHVHTPGTKKNDQFTHKGSNDPALQLNEKWDNYVNAINSYPDDISVIGITDYVCIDNYFRFKDNIASGKIKKKFDLVIPNIELRIYPVTDKATPINIHFLFNPDIDQDIETRFLSKLEFEHNGSMYSATRSDLIRLGKSINSVSDDNLAIKEAVSKYVISLDCVRNIFKKDQTLRKDTVIIVANGKDGVSAVRKQDNSGQLELVLDNLYSFVDAIFSATPSDIDHFLGNSNTAKNEVIKRYGSLKACVHGSDAHTEDRLFSPDDNKYCWIKTEPTFEGLKQIIYEPEERVKIDVSKPEQKSSYLVIDKCKYIDSSFMADELVFSNNLTVVIGGKSTGKSLLLRNIAEAIDLDQVSKKLTEVDIPPYKKQVNGFSVSWLDGQINQKIVLSKDNSTGNILDNTEIGKKIIYIPQSYLNRLSDNNSNSAIADIIVSLLKQKDSSKRILEDLENEKQKINLKIFNYINELFSSLNEYHELNNQLKEIGNEDGITKELRDLKQEIESLQQQVGISVEDRELYISKHTEKNQLEKEINDINDNIAYLNQIKDITLADDPNLSPLKIEFESKINQKYQKLKLAFHQKWQEIVSESITEGNNLLSNNNKLLDECITVYNPLLEKMRKNNLLSENIKKANELSLILQSISVKKESLRQSANRYWSTSELLLNSYQSYFDLFNKITEELITESNLATNNLRFKFDVRFLAHEFYNKFVEQICDLRSISKFFNNADYKTSTPLNEYKFDNMNTFKSDLKFILNGIMDGKLSLKNNINKQEAITKLFDNRFDIHYDIIQGMDCLSTMSQGKKSLVLLQLLIEMDNSKCPILLDQPEDDLDNRSIYNELVKFIKHKKKERQIIIATHNPNLVVGADAECVIVAHQIYDSIDNSYKFEYVSGALENTFTDTTSNNILYKQGIQEHVCEILEGGKEAFKNRKNKYHIG